MKLSLYAVGRLKAGPERELFSRYGERIGRAGSQIGIGPLNVIEIDEARARSARERKKAEGEALARRIPSHDTMLVLDETGRAMTSREFSQMIAMQRDEGCKTLSFVIGGPDGLDHALLTRARHVLSFGRNSWPHGLVRVMLAEQIYRAVTILSGHPYHRD